jgi:hypothetical protein
MTNNNDESERSASCSGSGVDDIVDRLREWKDERGFPTPGELMDEAAGVIERLRRRLRLADAAIRATPSSQNSTDNPTPDEIAKFVEWHARNAMQERNRYP